MIEHEADGRRIEPGIERVQNAARHGHAVMGFEHRGGIGHERGDRIAAADALACQRRGQPARTRIELRIGIVPGAMNDGGGFGISERGRCKKEIGVSGW